MHSNRLRAMVISAVMGALALVLPVAFHAVGLGSKFLPMLLPLLLNGFLVPVRWAVFTGLATPWISALTTGMPPLYPPVVAVVSAEGAVLAGVSSAFYGQGKHRLWPALIAAITCGRASAFALMWLLARAFSLPPALASVSSILQGLPGVALQLAVVPAVLRLLSKRKGPLFMGDLEREA
jgi:hypothetical protein